MMNEMGWDSQPLSKLVNNNHGISCGPFGTQYKIADLLDSGSIVLGIENIGINRFIHTPFKCIPSKRLAEFNSFIVESKDIILSRAGTVGRCCIVPESFPIAILGSNLLKIRLNPQKMIPEFFTSAFSYFESMQKQIKRSSPGGSYSFLSTSKLGNIRIIVPPLSIQKQYANRISKIDTLQNGQKNMNNEIGILFKALSTKALAGELIA